MAGKSIPETTETPMDYSTLAGNLMREIDKTKSLVVGADSILDSIHNSDSSAEICSTFDLLLMINEHLESIRDTLDESQFKYEVKHV